MSTAVFSALSIYAHYSFLFYQCKYENASRIRGCAEEQNWNVPSLSWAGDWEFWGAILLWSIFPSADLWCFPQTGSLGPSVKCWDFSCLCLTPSKRFTNTGQSFLSPFRLLLCGEKKQKTKQNKTNLQRVEINKQNRIEGNQANKVHTKNHFFQSWLTNLTKCSLLGCTPYKSY